MSSKYVIAIDGPSGVGKTSTSKMVAEKLGYFYVDTGALYRAIALKTLQASIKPQDLEGLKKMLGNLEMRIASKKDRMRVIIDGKDVTGSLRTKEVTERSSRIAAIREVREFLIGIQRQAGAEGGVVMEGRDIGTVIFPDTKYKFFLDASIEERARRRYRELKNGGVEATLAEIRDSIEKRDRRDTARETNPLKKASDARVIDSTKMSIEEVVNCITSIIK